MLLLLFILFTAMPLAELFLLFEISDRWGAGNTILLVLVTGVIGAYLAKSQGRAVLVRIQNQMARGNIPTDELIHGLLVFAGGLLLVTPGVVTDVLGFCFVLPGTRRLVTVIIRKWFSRKLAAGEFQIYSNVNSQKGGFEFHSVNINTWGQPGEEARDVTPRSIKDVNQND
ncbi:MAG: FxsA family protein [Bdellovibrionales bacterium]